MKKTTSRKVTSYVVMDFETGGLEMDKCGITEVALISIKGDTLEKINEYESLISPHQILNKEGNWINARYDVQAEAVTGLSVSKLKKDGKPIEQVVEELIEKLTEANVSKSKTGYKPVLVAHNAQFEVKCLQNLANGRFDLSKYFHGDKDFYGNFTPHFIDTLDLAKLLWAANERHTSYKLADVLDRASIPIYDAHRAMNDVKPSTEFFQYAIRLLRAAEKSSVLSTLIQEEGENTTNYRTFKFQFK